MTHHDVTLAKREPVAQGTMAFHLGKPAGFAFLAGQAIDLVLPGEPGPDAQGARHTFSLASAPFQDELVVATRMRDSAYKRALGALPVGARVRIEGPSGSLTLHDDRARAAVFIAGGIGITPFMSILRQAAKERQPRRLALLYSNRRPEDAAFLAELQGLARQDPGFRLVATMTDMAQSARPWDGPTGSIDKGVIERIAGDLPEPIYYLAGPPAMVEAVRGMLDAAGTDDDDVLSEEFFGY